MSSLLLRSVCALTLLSGCYVETLDNRPCDSSGRCLPGYVCRKPENLCINPARGTTVQLVLHTQSCDTTKPTLEGVTHLLPVVTVEGVTVKLSTVDPRVTTPTVQVAPGVGRVVELRAYAGDPNAGGRLISLGRSAPLTITDQSTVPVTIDLTLRRVNTFVPITSAAGASECQSLKVARTDHTATLLKNGRVLIAGGWNFKQGTQQEALSSTEIFDPATGVFENATPLSLTAQGATYVLPRANHTATLLDNGQVFFLGGETYTGASNLVSIVSTGLVYDADVNAFGALGPRSNPPNIPRSRHSATKDQGGRVLIIGGLRRETDGGIALVPEVEWLNPNALTLNVVPSVSLPREGAVTLPLRNGELIAVAGGSSGAAMERDVALFKFSGQTFDQQASSPRLATGRKDAVGAVVRSGGEVLIIGGYASANSTNPLGSAELVSADVVRLAPDARTPRGSLCAVTLLDGSVLAVGGRTLDMTGPARSDGTAVLFSMLADGGSISIGAPNLPRARYGHTCTLLNDGTVLVLGGVDETLSGTTDVLRDAYLYTPLPID